MDDVQGVLARSALFRGVPNALISEIAASSEARLLGARERLLTAGNPNDKLHVIVAGGVTIRGSGDLHEAEHRGVGDCVGEISIVEERPVLSDAIADRDTVVLSIDRDRLWALVDASPDLARNLLKLIAGRASREDALPGQSLRLKRYFERIATVDALTGLHNRRWLEDAFARQIERAHRSEQPTALLLIDIDHLRRINEHFGHLAGDAALGRVAQILMTCVRPQDLLARCGGEEFAVLLPAIDLHSAVAVAERLRRSVEASARDSDARDVPATTVSIGAVSLEQDDRLSDLMTRGEIALLRAKTRGRNRTEC